MRDRYNKKCRRKYNHDMEHYGGVRSYKKGGFLFGALARFAPMLLKGAYNLVKPLYPHAKQAASHVANKLISRGTESLARNIGRRVQDRNISRPLQSGVRSVGRAARQQIPRYLPPQLPPTYQQVPGMMQSYWQNPYQPYNYQQPYYQPQPYYYQPPPRGRRGRGLEGKKRKNENNDNKLEKKKIARANVAKALMSTFG